MSALEGGHRAHHRLDPVELTLVERVQLVAHLRHARHHAQDRLEVAHLLDRLHLLQEVVEGEVLLVHELLGHRRGLTTVERALGLLDEGEHVTHVEDARGHAVGVEDLNVLHTLADGGVQDRLTGDGRDRQRRTTAGVTVQLRQHDTGEVDALAERERRLDRGLTDHRVDHEQHLVRLDRVTDVTGLLHQTLVDGKASGGVDDHDVVLAHLRLADAGACHPDRVAEAARAFTGFGGRVVAALVAALGSEARHSGALGDDLELTDGVRTLQVGRDQEREVALVAQMAGQLAGEGRLTRTLQTGEHDDGRAGLGHVEIAGLAAEDRDEFLVDDLHDLLARVQRRADLGSERTLADASGELAHHGGRDVGVDQRHPNVTDGGVDVGLGQSTLATDVLEGGCEAVTQAVEHRTRVIGRAPWSNPRITVRICGFGGRALVRPASRR